MRIKSITKVQSTSKRYDIGVEKNHNFYANDVLVHNSLGIVFWDKHADRPRVSTRGSLESDQAQWATAWLNEQLLQHEHKMLRRELVGSTYLVEIIYPENRIVVRYDFAGLVLLDRVYHHNLTSAVQIGALRGVCRPASWREATSFAPSTLNELLDRAKDLPGMEEGFVCTYEDGLKVKIKGHEYIRLHRIRFDLTPRRVHELMANCGGAYNATLDTLLKAVPDEFADPVMDAARVLVKRFTEARHHVEWHAETAQLEARGERKKMALYCKANLEQPLWPAFFAVLDGDEERGVKAIWKAIDYKDIVI